MSCCFPSSEGVVLSVIPRVTATISLLGSAWIVVDVVRDRKKWNMSYHRLVLGMSVSDCLASFSMAFSTLPIPKDTANPVYGASGTVATCTAQGFFQQVGLATPLYSGFLSIYFWFQVVASNKWNEGRAEIKRLELCFHIFTWGMALSTSLASLGLQLYNNAALWCWIAPVPWDCVTTIEAEDGIGTCQRGDNSFVYRIAFYFTWLWLSNIVVVVSMTMIFVAVYTQAKRVQKYETVQQQPSSGLRVRLQRNKIIQKVAVQSSLYIGAFLLTTLPVSIMRLLNLEDSNDHFALNVMAAVLYPLQGFWNFVIYMRPRYLAYRNANPSSGVLATWCRAMARTWSAFSSGGRVAGGGGGGGGRAQDNGYKLGTSLELVRAGMDGGDGVVGEDDNDYKLGTPLEMGAILTEERSVQNEIRVTSVLPPHQHDVGRDDGQPDTDTSCDPGRDHGEDELAFDSIAAKEEDAVSHS